MASSSGLTFVDGTIPMPLMQLPIRTTLVEVGGGRVLLSPASTLTKAQLEHFGEVTDVVATSLMHTGGMVAAATAHPKARVWGPPGSAEKLPALRWGGTLGSDPWPYETELGVTALDGMPRAREHVFLHRASRTLLVSDLAFHIEAPRGLGAWLVLNIFGTHARFGVSRLFTMLVKDRDAFRASVAHVSTLDFDRLVPAHGSIVEQGAKAKLLAALRERGYEAG